MTKGKLTPVINSIRLAVYTLDRQAVELEYTNVISYSLLLVLSNALGYPGNVPDFLF